MSLVDFQVSIFTSLGLFSIPLKYALNVVENNDESTLSVAHNS